MFHRARERLSDAALNAPGAARVRDGGRANTAGGGTDPLSARKITILDRAGLEEAACECYFVMRSALEEAVGPA
jgi:hypothetical protein